MVRRTNGPSVEAKISNCYLPAGSWKNSKKLIKNEIEIKSPGNSEVIK